MWLQFEIDDDGGLKVNGRMETAVPDVYAAGDVCHATWKHSELWLQVWDNPCSHL